MYHEVIVHINVIFSSRQTKRKHLQLRRILLRHYLETNVERSVNFFMNLLMVIFGLIAIFGVVGIFQSIKQKNILAVVFNAATAGVFGWFVIMTIINQGYPPVAH